MPVLGDIVTPDPDRLDTEWVRQPGLMLKYCELEADARHERDQAKARLDLAKAELLLEVRGDPESYDLPKRPNKEVVDAAVVSHERYRKAQRKFLDKCHEADICGAAVRALDNRKKSLEKLVELHATSYYSEPRTPKNAGQFGEEAKKQAARQGITSRGKKK